MALPVIIIGVSGLLFIAIGWALAISDVPPLRLTMPYLAGSALLTIYSVLDWNVVFLILNGAATVLSAINLVRGIRKYKGRVKEHE